MKSIFRRLGLPAVILVIFGLGFSLGDAHSKRGLATAETYDHLKVFAEVLSLIQDKYVDPKDPNDLMVGAIRGMMKTLDPHSSYMTPEFYQEMQMETEGEFEGLGIEITIKDDYVTVISPIEESPAFKAGLKSGDKIIKVDGQTTKDMSIMDAVKLMRGKQGTSVVVTIFREGFEEPKDITIVRQTIHVRSVKSTLIENHFGYVKIRSFTKNTSEELGEALRPFAEKKVKGLVLDLRNNPGGLLNQAVEVTSLFLPTGSLVVSTKGRVEDQNMNFTAQGKLAFPEVPIVVLVNEGSASASEIVAGALQDVKRGVIVGKTSFGKGSVQTIYPLSDGSGLRLTTAHYFTPAGRLIQDKGIKPDIEVEPTYPSAKEETQKTGKTEEGETEQQPAKGPEPEPDRGVQKQETPASESAPQVNETSEESMFPLVDLKKDRQLIESLNILRSWDIFKGAKS